VLILIGFPVKAFGSLLRGAVWKNQRYYWKPFTMIILWRMGIPELSRTKWVTWSTFTYLVCGVWGEGLFSDDEKEAVWGWAGCWHRELICWWLESWRCTVCDSSMSPVKVNNNFVLISHICLFCHFISAFDLLPEKRPFNWYLLQIWA
jgi:hypothetical protein